MWICLPTDSIHSWTLISAENHIPKPEPKCFTSTFKGEAGLCIPLPFCLISSCLAKICKDQSKILVIIPTWQSQMWFPLILYIFSESSGFNSNEMQNNFIPNGSDPPILNKTLLLAGWKVSGSWSFRGTYDLLVQSWKSGTWSAYDCAWKGSWSLSKITLPG